MLYNNNGILSLGIFFKDKSFEDLTNSHHSYLFVDYKYLKS